MFTWNELEGLPQLSRYRITVSLCPQFPRWRPAEEAQVCIEEIWRLISDWKYKKREREF